MSSSPPQLELSLPTNTTSFKRSFEEFGFDLDSPVSGPNIAGSSSNNSNNNNGSSSSTLDGNERNKRARSASTVPDVAPTLDVSVPIVAETEDIEMADTLLQIREPSPPPRLEILTAAASNTTDSYRLSLERFDSFEQHIAAIRTSPTTTRTQTPPPMLPPIIIPSSPVQEAPSPMALTPPPRLSLPPLPESLYTSGLPLPLTDSNVWRFTNDESADGESLTMTGSPARQSPSSLDAEPGLESRHTTDRPQVLRHTLPTENTGTSSSTEREINDYISVGYRRRYPFDDTLFARPMPPHPEFTETRRSRSPLRSSRMRWGEAPSESPPLAPDHWSSPWEGPGNYRARMQNTSAEIRPSSPTSSTRAESSSSSYLEWEAANDRVSQPRRIITMPRRHESASARGRLIPQPPLPEITFEDFYHGTEWAPAPRERRPVVDRRALGSAREETETRPILESVFDRGRMRPVLHNLARPTSRERRAANEREPPRDRITDPETEPTPFFRERLNSALERLHSPSPLIIPDLNPEPAEERPTPVEEPLVYRTSTSRLPLIPRVDWDLPSDSVFDTSSSSSSTFVSHEGELRNRVRRPPRVEPIPSRTSVGDYEASPYLSDVWSSTHDFNFLNSPHETPTSRYRPLSLSTPHSPFSREFDFLDSNEPWDEEEERELEATIQSTINDIRARREQTRQHHEATMARIHSRRALERLTGDEFPMRGSAADFLARDRQRRSSDLRSTLDRPSSSNSRYSTDNLTESLARRYGRTTASTRVNTDHIEHISAPLPPPADSWYQVGEPRRMREPAALPTPMGRRSPATGTLPPISSYQAPLNLERLNFRRPYRSSLSSTTSLVAETAAERRRHEDHADMLDRSRAAQISDTERDIRPTIRREYEPLQTRHADSPSRSPVMPASFERMMEEEEMELDELTRWNDRIQSVFSRSNRARPLVLPSSRQRSVERSAEERLPALPSHDNMFDVEDYASPTETSAPEPSPRMQGPPPTIPARPTIDIESLAPGPFRDTMAHLARNQRRLAESRAATATHPPSLPPLQFQARPSTSSAGHFDDVMSRLRRETAQRDSRRLEDMERRQLLLAETTAQARDNVRRLYTRTSSGPDVLVLPRRSRDRSRDSTLTETRTSATATEAAAAAADLPAAGSLFRSQYLANFPGFTRRRSRFGDYMRDEDFDASYENLMSLASSIGDVRPRTTSQSVIDALPTGLYSEWSTPESDSRCPICLDDYSPDDPLLKLTDCSHWLHKACLEQWLKTANTCPVCRQNVGPTETRSPSVFGRGGLPLRRLPIRRPFHSPLPRIRPPTEAPSAAYFPDLPTEPETTRNDAPPGLFPTPSARPLWSRYTMMRGAMMNGDIPSPSVPPRREDDDNDNSNNNAEDDSSAGFSPWMRRYP